MLCPDWFPAVLPIYPGMSHLGFLPASYTLPQILTQLVPSLCSGFQYFLKSNWYNIQQMYKLHNVNVLKKKSFVCYLIIPQLLELCLAHQKFSKKNILQRNKWPHLLLPTFSGLWFLSKVTLVNSSSSSTSPLNLSWISVWGTMTWEVFSYLTILFLQLRSPSTAPTLLEFFRACVLNDYN